MAEENGNNNAENIQVRGGMLREGDAFGPYRAVKSLGKGGMGEVWLLQHEDNGYLFAVKFLSGEGAGNRESRKRFLREAQLAMAVNHPNLVKVYDVGEDPDTGLCYILMEYVSGGTLRNRIREQGCLSVEESLRIVRGIASVLEATSAYRVVHRDIKPDNILFTPEGVPKLSDLGIARVRTDKTLTTVTVDGSVIGTPVYMAPEQVLDSHHVDVRADIYSLGIVLFEMLAGRRPWTDEGLVQMMARAVQRKEIIDVRNFRKSVPEAVSGLLRRMCAARVEQRIASPRQIVNLCGSLLGEKSSPTAGLAPGVRRSPASGGRRTSSSAVPSRTPNISVGRARDAFSRLASESDEPVRRGPSPLVWVLGAIALLLLLCLLGRG